MTERVPQLRRQLLGWLLAPLVLLLVADSLVGYRLALGIAERAHDRVLVEVARDVALHLRGAGGALQLDLTPEAQRALFSGQPERIAFEVATPDGQRIAGEPIARAGAVARGRAGEKLYDGELGGAPVRIVELEVQAAADRPAAIVHVAETMEARDALTREILLSELLPQMLLIAIAGIVVWYGVVRGLAPLQRLQRALAARSPLDRSPLSERGVPGEVRPLLASINELLARLDAALTLQTRFIADAAHQLKTPIAALRAQLDVALREPDPARMRESVQAAYPGLERLSRLASQLLSLARNEPDAAGAARLAPLDLNALALDVATGWVPAARKRGIDLGFEAAGAPVPLRGDAGRLRELLDNLVDNAVRYSRGGGRVTVRVRAAPAPALEVSDDSPAIPPDERERVFERFHRLLGAHDEGSGLGLAIAREIARLHGAEIALRDDSDGVGNTFTVTFPAA